MRSESKHDRNIPWPVMESSLWLRAGILSVGVTVLAIVMLVTGESNALLAIGWVLAGGAFGVYALRRSWMLLDEPLDDVVPTAKPEAAPYLLAKPAARERAALQH